MEITDITRESDDAVQEMVVTMTASADEVNTYIDKAFKELAKNEIPGFRKGKAPREVIEREAGGHDMVFARIAEDIVNGEAPALLDDADVLFIGDPQFNLEKIPRRTSRSPLRCPVPFRQRARSRVMTRSRSKCRLTRQPRQKSRLRSTSC